VTGVYYSYTFAIGFVDSVDLLLKNMAAADVVSDKASDIILRDLKILHALLQLVEHS